MTLSDRVNKLAAAVSVPWSSFVVAFLYYTLLAIVVLGGGSLGAGSILFAYAVPPAMYVATLALRASRTVVSLFAGRTAALTPTAHSAA